jgi:hypothetical protein
MKTMKNIIGTLIIIFCYSFSNAQVQATPAQWVGVEKEMIRSRAFIFEGRVISQSNISKTELTCSVIQITKIFKGSPQIKLGTIKILTEQSSGMKDGGVGLSKRGTYIIFGNPTNSTIFDSIIADNSITLTANNSIVFTGDNSAQWGTNLYKPLDSLYSVFKRNGLMVQEEVNNTKQK